MTKFHEFRKSSHALTQALTTLWIKLIQKTESYFAYLDIVLWSMNIRESSVSDTLCVLKTLFHVFFFYNRSISGNLFSEFDAMFFSFLNIVTTVLSAAWQFYRDVEMIDIFIGDNV